MDRKPLSDIARKKRVFAYAEEVGNIAKACQPVRARHHPGGLSQGQFEQHSDGQTELDRRAGKDRWAA